MLLFIFWRWGVLVFAFLFLISFINVIILKKKMPHKTASKFEFLVVGSGYLGIGEFGKAFISLVWGSFGYLLLKLLLDMDSGVTTVLSILFFGFVTYRRYLRVKNYDRSKEGLSSGSSSDSNFDVRDFMDKNHHGF